MTHDADDMVEIVLSASSSSHFWSTSLQGFLESNLLHIVVIATMAMIIVIRRA